ncbi:MAG: DUF1624 domain-containing protein [Rhizobiales bacterium]|nr:DUF1624 domain-containing protein [Hyphomicrobiales bacterium]
MGVDLRGQPIWVWFGHGIAATFLVLVGVGLVLSHGRGFRPRAFFRRLGLVAGGAALVSAGTFIVFPEQFIFFGILHAIALGSILALPFLRLPAWAVLFAALMVAVLPSFVQSEALSRPWLVWLGLGTRVPSTQDFVPVFPWFGYVLAGTALAKIIDFRRFTRPLAESAPRRALVWTGRNSLAIYLIHQPILFGALSIVAMALTPAQEMQARGFLSTCQSHCRAAGRDEATCISACRCSVEGLRAGGLWSAVREGRLDPMQQALFESITKRCAEPPAQSPQR